MQTKRSRDRDACLLPEAEPAYQRAVAVDVFTIQVVKETTTLADQFQQPAPGAVVMFVLAQVLGQFDDPSCQQRDLNF